MGTDGSPTDRARIALLVWSDVLGYALAVAALAVVAALVVAVATGGGVLRAKVVLFLAGFALMGYATVRLWPTSPEDVGETDGVGRSIPAPGDRTRFQSAVRALPPLRWLSAPPPTRRMSPAGKLFLASLLVLLASYLMETVLGV